MNVLTTYFIHNYYISFNFNISSFIHINGVTQVFLYAFLNYILYMLINVTFLATSLLQNTIRV